MKIDIVQAARTFSRLLLEDVGSNNLKKIDELNRLETNPRICHSHDYCCSGPEGFMVEVFREQGFDMNAMFTKTGDAANAKIWELAKRKGFSTLAVQG